MPEDHSDAVRLIKQKIEQPAEDSKKWCMAMIGLKGVAGFFGVGMIMICFRPDQSSHITSMVSVVLPSWGGIIAVYLGGQASVDFRSMAAIEKVDQNRTENIKEERLERKEEKIDIKEERLERIEHVIVEGDPGAPARKPFSQTGDEG